MSEPDEVRREILGAFWKIHILHHAAQEPIAGLWMLEELREHGYELSPGTLYPLLQRMVARGWLERHGRRSPHPKAAKLYRITPRGRRVLAIVRQQLAELIDEVAPPAEDAS